MSPRSKAPNSKAPNSKAPVRLGLLLGVSAAALSAAAPALAGASSNPFARVSDPAAAAAQAAAAQASQAASASTVSQQTLAAFAQAVAARNAMDAKQAAARAAALAAQAGIPNGLTPGGLVVDPNAGSNPSLWVGAGQPTQTTSSNGRTEVSIQQTAPQAILNWQTFNVGRETDLTFKQGASSWVVLNRVNDPSANPTQILGTISAPGTVLIMNANGVIFGGSSQVNVGSLIAGAAQISDSQFLDNGIYSSTSGTTYAAAFTNALGAVSVQAGAQITTNAPTSVTTGGGYVMLLGGSVSNAGDITTPMGQTLMAAGDSFLLRPGLGTSANQYSTTRGTEVAPVIAADSVNGAVSNTGEIYSQQGDITLAGRTITQGGVLLSTTSVSQRGTIHLLNSATDSQGSVTLESGSYTGILPELDSTATALDSQRAALIADSATEDQARIAGATTAFNDLSLLADREDESRVEIVTGGNVEFQSGSMTQAQGGQVAVSAAGRIQVDTAATIDVSGVLDVAMNVQTNAIEVNIQGAQEADSPVNRDAGLLFNDNVWVDARDLIYVPAGTGGDPNARYYTPGGLLEVSGFLADTGHTIGEWAAAGGTITLSAPEVVAQTGSVFNISGGSLAYQAGYVPETLLQGANGLLYTADDAPADIEMLTVGQSYTENHDRWGPSYAQTYSNPFTQTTVDAYEPGYVVGKDGGQLILSTPTAIFQGTINAAVVQGQDQTGVRPQGAVDPYALSQSTAPLPGGLYLGQYNANGLLGAYATDVQFDSSVPDAASGLTISRDPTTGQQVLTPIPADRVGTAWFDANQLSSFGLGTISVATSGSVAVNALLTLADGGSLTLVGSEINLNANVIAHAGSISLSNIFRISAASGGDTFEFIGADPVDINVAAGVTLDLSGLWVNALTNPLTSPNLAFVNGGSLSIDSTNNVSLGAGSVVDVSSGAGVLSNGKTVGGTGGNVTLIAGDPTGFNVSVGTMTLDGTIKAYGVNGGGVLTITTPSTVVIGQDASISGGTLAAGTSADVSVALAAALTIPAGTPLPMDYAATLTQTPVDTALPWVANMAGYQPDNEVTQAPWQVPSGIGQVAVYGTGGSFNYYYGGNTVPAGSRLYYINGSLPAGFVVPSAVFPNGLPMQPITEGLAQGSIQTSAVVYPVGYIVPAGTVLPQTVQIGSAQSLSPNLFQSGFSGYNITGGSGVLVASGTALDPVMPVYQFTGASFSAPTGVAPSTALSLWTPPLYVENPTTGALTQRGGASVTLSAVSEVNFGGGGAIVVAPGASITVDPSQSITLDAFNQLTIDGDLTAHGGSINLNSAAAGNSNVARNFDASGNPLGYSVWIDQNAVLDVSGASYGALDQYGRAYGVATNGGSISISGLTDFVVVRPGAVLDADGAAVTMNSLAGTNGPAAGVNSTVATSGGSIALESDSGIYNEGNLHAFAGGAGAGGGSLSISLDSPAYTNGTISTKYLVFGVMEVVQSLDGSLLPTGVTPGTAASSLQFGQATVSADAIAAGGFDKLTLSSQDFLQFSGDVSLTLGQSVTLKAAAITSGAATTIKPDGSETPQTGSVQVNAPYVLLTSYPTPSLDGTVNAVVANPGAGAFPTTATFQINADEIDVQGPVVFSASQYTGSAGWVYSPGYQTVTLNSQGDIRFLTPAANTSASALASAYDINLIAAQIYPTTGASATVYAGENNLADNSVLTIQGIAGDNPAMPLSVFGCLYLEAPIVNQGGIVRAPLGSIYIGDSNYNGWGLQVNLLPGSITSTSAAGLTVPYGGTTDGVTYNYDGSAVTPAGFGVGLVKGVTLDATTIDVQKGATLDLSGGGTVTGAGFISGRGGSVDVLTTPLANANPATPLSKSSDQVYAILPGYGGDYAPQAMGQGAGDPAIGEQITIPAGVPGLPAGTYTLLPANYALLPGAFRVELGKPSSTQAGGVSSIGNGTYAAAAYTSTANTGVKSALPSLALITSGTAVRNYSQYDEEGYAAFLTAKAAQFGGARPVLPDDAGTLTLDFEASLAPTTSSALIFNGSALLQGASTDGFAGQVLVQPGGDYYQSMEIYADGSAPTAGFQIPSIQYFTSTPTTVYQGVSIDAADLDAIAAPRLVIGGSESLFSNTNIVQFSAPIYMQGLYIRDNVTLKAGELFLLANAQGITVQSGATLTTIGQGAAPFDSSDGFVFDSSATLLALSNGVLDFISGSSGAGAITVQSGASLYSGGTLEFVTSGLSSIDSNAHFGSANIGLAVGTINIGSDADIAAAGAPTGLTFNQSLFNLLVNGDPTNGAPKLQSLSLTASNSINLFGDAGLDAGGTGIDLILTTPAIYGYGAAGDTATIAANKITWNGGVGAAPPAIVPGGVGTGSGVLTLQASEIDLGAYSAPLDTSSGGRVAYGFSTVNLIASTQIVSAGSGSLSVYQAPSTTPGAVLGQSGVGGDLVISTPLLTGLQASVMAYTAGGNLTINAPAGTTPSQATSTVAGAEIDLNANAVDIGSTILLPSGKLVVNATGNITLDAGSRLDVSGQPSTIEQATVYGFGGSVTLNSAQGGVSQAAGGVINVSATDAVAGSISIGAGSGAVSLEGSLQGSASNGYTSGDFSVTAGSLADFAGLNAILTQGGVFDARSFDIKSGDLTIGDGVQAHNVTVSIDNGSLTVDGTIDASGATAGSIRLSAMNGLTIASTGVLDAHGTVLQVDSYGNPIDAKNTAEIELNAAGGTLTLAPGAIFNLSSPDGVARGQINLDATRTSETGGDVNISASGPVNISGASSIAVNAFWTYSPTDPYGTIVQDNGGTTAVSATTGYLGMDQVDAQSNLFINAALTNAGLQARLAGLETYTDAFHLRPGVQIESATPNGTLTIAGAIDLSGFRYASLNPNFQKTSVYGSGEPGDLVIRAGGNLDVVGSISDGFMPAPATPNDNGWLLQTGVQANSVETLAPITLTSGTTFPNTAGALRYAIPINGATIQAGVVIPAQVTLSSTYTVPAGTTLAAPIYASDGTTVLYAAGTTLSVAVTLPQGAQLGAGSVMPGQVGVAAMTWPAGATLDVFTGTVSLSGSATVPFEGIIPSGTNVQMATATAPTRLTGSSGTQGSILAISPMLPAGELSWSITLVAGADLTAADPRIVKPASLLKALGISGNLTLGDTHVANLGVAKYFYYYGTTKYYTYSPTGWGCTHYGNTSCGVAIVQQITGVDPSVVRTGTGDLNLIAGGSFDEQSLFGVYTAGTQSQPILVNGQDLYNSPLGVLSNGAPLSAANAAKSAADLAAYQAWYPENGGNLLLSAQGDVTGYIGVGDNTTRYVNSDLTSNWLWRQGGAGLATQPTSWWINFGTFAETYQYAADATLIGFQGIGTLGGGNLTVIAGGNAGELTKGTTGLDLAVASTGRVLPNGTIVETGGGDLTVKIGGALNPWSNAYSSPSIGQDGMITDLRGDISVTAGSIGTITPNLGAADWQTIDPRTLPSTDITKTNKYGGVEITPGDGTATFDTRGNLIVYGASDAGMADPTNLAGVSANVITGYNSDGTPITELISGATTRFMLWTPTTSIALYSAGGDVGNEQQTSGNFFPATLKIAAANGDIYFAEASSVDYGAPTIELTPSPVGQLSILAAGSIYGEDEVVAMSGAAMSSLATPTHPLFQSSWSSGGGVTNMSPTAGGLAGYGNSIDPLAFGSDTPTGNLHAGDTQPALVEAGVDIQDLTLGQVMTVQPNLSDGFNPAITTWYIGAKPFNVIAGRDIIGSGLVSDVFVNNIDSDITLIQAGRDIIYMSATIAGPGLLDVQAGRNLYQGDMGVLQSVGPLYNVDPTIPSGGAGIVAMAGVGPNGPDYADFAKLYFDPANLLPANGLLAGSGKVLYTYNNELFAWLQQRFGYTGTSAGALNYFLALPSDQQGVFVRQVYYEELNAGGIEYNDPTSRLFHSYLRGELAISTLFPTEDANGNPITYSGGITMFSGTIKPSYGNPYTADSSIRTEYGGDIQILDPGGQTILGTEGITPGAGAGLLTQGAGDIDIYSEGSVLLGESRILTTFGGDILAWSATGDINAGRGSKTTVVFTPPRRVYDDWGAVTLSPQVPSTGAGIGTLNPIPQIPPGDIDLIAPLGTVDAGEAGIRVSGDLNIAALHVVNAANIQVQGTATGLPQAVEVNTGALTAASNAASAVTTIANQIVQRARPQTPPQAPLIVFGRFLGFGDDGQCGDDSKTCK